MLARERGRGRAHGGTNSRLVVVGGGFAGVVAARELSKRGLRSIVLEVRDRLGGRTRLRPNAIRGQPLEMGGIWIDPRQERSWAEAETYAIRVREPVLGAPPTTWLIRGERRIGPFPVAPSDLGALERLVRRIGNDASRIDPGRPLGEQSVEGLDVPLPEYVLATEAPARVADAAVAYLSMYGSAPPQDVSALHLLRRISAAGSFAEFVMSGASHPLANGTEALVDSIVRDADVEVKLSCLVVRIEQTRTSVSVATTDHTFTGKPQCSRHP